MSNKATGTVCCPHCGYNYKATLWNVVNGDESPRLKNKILKGEFFVHKCKKCGESIVVPHDVLFESLNNRALIYYAHRITNFAESERIVNDRKAMWKDDETQIRVVRSRQALREKVRIIDMGLDDRVIEVMKALIVESYTKNHKIEKIDEVCCWVRDDGNFDITIFAETDIALIAKSDFYNYLIVNVYHQLEEQDANPTVVDMDYAFEFLELNNFVCDN